MRHVTDFLVLVVLSLVLASCAVSTAFGSQTAPERRKSTYAASPYYLPTRYTRSELKAHIAAALPNAPERERSAALWLILRESGGNPRMQNKRTSSHGLNGFLRSTWTNVVSRSRSKGRLRYSLHPPDQIKALAAYAVPRYGSLCGARSFHRKHGYY